MITATRVTAAAFGAAALLAPAGLAGTASAAEPPSVVQLCAATDIAAVDALLDGVASSGLVGSLAPLASLTVPQDPDGVTVKADVELEQVRTALSCTPATDEPAPTEEPAPTTTPVPTSEAPPTDDVLFEDCAAAVAAGAAPIVLANGEVGYRMELDRDGDGVACEVNEDLAPTGSPTIGSPTTTPAPSSGGFSQLDDVPSKAAETGGGPA